MLFLFLTGLFILAVGLFAAGKIPIKFAKTLLKPFLMISCLRISPCLSWQLIHQDYGQSNACDFFLHRQHLNTFRTKIENDDVSETS